MDIMESAVRRVGSKAIEVEYHDEEPLTTVTWRRMKAGRYMGQRSLSFDGIVGPDEVARAVMAYEADVDHESAEANWAKDDIQFPRLLAEIVSTLELTQDQIDEIAESMDLESGRVDELFDRALAAWERIKADTT
jgi:hypothetical protein